MSRLPLQSIITSYDQLNEQMSSITDTQEMIKLAKKHKKLSKQNDLAIIILKAEQELQENEKMLTELSSNDEMYDMTVEEIDQLKEKVVHHENELLIELTPQDPRDEMNILLEIRAGAGGDESSLFASEMLRMYEYACNELGFRMSMNSSSPNPVGGLKEVIIEIKGDNAYEWFKYEGGVHRVQRVPATEKQGRVHTSTISIAVMPLIEKNNDFKLDLSEVEIIATTSTGAGGQSVNTTYSAIQVRHKPTGIEARSQDERNQLQNKEKALQVLTSRVYDFYEEERRSKEEAERRGQVGRADRSEKIRTYNFPQDRCTDHRYNTNWSQLPAIMNGKIVDIIKDIRKLAAEQALNEINLTA